jgi:hypothetical protein
VVNHNNEKQYVRVTHADTEYNNLELIKEELVIPDSEFYFLDNPLNFNKKTETHYRAKKPNLTSYTLEMAFKVENKGVAINVDDISFTYDEVTKELILENKTKIKVMPVKGYQRIELTVKNDSAKVYFNKEYVAEIPHEKSKEELKINTINSQADIGYVTVRSNTEPVIVNYRIPDKAPQKTLSLPSVSLVTQLQNLSSERQKEIMTTFFEYDSIFWDNYKLRTEYSITSINSSIKLVLTDLQKELYSIEVYNQTIELSYTKGGEVKKVLHTLQAIPSHKILVDAKGNNITINFDNVVVLKETLDKASRGVLLIDYNNLDIDKLQVENPDTGEIRSRETSSAECSPLLIKETIYTGTAIIEKDAKKAFRTTVNFKEEFDIAKVALQLDSGEEIHFWVTQE